MKEKVPQIFQKLPSSKELRERLSQLIRETESVRSLLRTVEKVEKRLKIQEGANHDKP